MPSKNKKLEKKEDSLLFAFKFVSLFLVISAITYLLLSITSLPNLLAAFSSQIFLKAFFGVDSTLILNSAYPLLITPNLSAEIVDLCSGKIEIAVMLGIILGSFEKKRDYRIRGAIVGILLLLAFNALRISTTVYFFDIGNLQWSAVFHDVLFRIFLIVVIVTYFAIWYYYDQPRKKKA